MLNLLLQMLDADVILMNPNTLQLLMEQNL